MKWQPLPVLLIMNKTKLIREVRQERQGRQDRQGSQGRQGRQDVQGKWRQAGQAGQAGQGRQDRKGNQGRQGRLDLHGKHARKNGARVQARGSHSPWGQGWGGVAGMGKGHRQKVHTLKGAGVGLGCRDGARVQAKGAHPPPSSLPPLDWIGSEWNGMDEKIPASIHACMCLIYHVALYSSMRHTIVIFTSLGFPSAFRTLVTMSSISSKMAPPLSKQT